MIQKTIFEKLFEKQICFAVTKSYLSAKCKSMAGRVPEWYVMIHIDEKKKIRGFIKNDEFPLIGERAMTMSEIKEFKDVQHYFLQVQSDADGEVYELIGNSFKHYYDKIFAEKQTEGITWKVRNNIHTAQVGDYELMIEPVKGKWWWCVSHKDSVIRDSWTGEMEGTKQSAQRKTIEVMQQHVKLLLA